MAADLSGIREAVQELGVQTFDGGSADLLTKAETQADARHGGHESDGEHMRDSGHVEMFTASGDLIAGSIGFDAPQAEWTNTGTTAHDIEGNPWLVFEMGGQTIFVKSPKVVHHPGYAGDNWFDEIVTDPEWEQSCQGAADAVTVVAS